MSLKRAIEIAREAHKGQKDKGGNDYFTSHIQTVIDGVDSEKEKIVAALHDTVEDTEITLDDLRAEFDEEIVSAVEVLTHRGEPCFEYIEKIKTNPLAVAVKKSDLRSNMDISRILHPTEKDFARLEKYKRAYEMLK